MTCDIYPCILAYLAFVDLTSFMFYMCCCLYLFLNLILLLMLFFILFLNLFIVIVGIIAPSELMFFVCKPTLNKTSYILYLISYGPIQGMYFSKNGPIKAMLYIVYKIGPTKGIFLSNIGPLQIIDFSFGPIKVMLSSQGELLEKSIPSSNGNYGW